MNSYESKPFVTNRARHRFGKYAIPYWIHDKRYWLLFTVLTLLIGIPVALLGSGPSKRALEPSERAAISAVYGPSRTWDPTSPKHLREITTKIHNNGPAAAELVDVQVSVSGKIFRLNGPQTIPVGATVDYAGEGETHPDQYAAITLYLSCLNCTDPITKSM